ncbi:major capsid protein [Acidovorax sp.]|uniref:major capsid protein n=1 Tax=Acidovorax sp. TaxID=1872122 RepID=UPI00403788A2
MNSISMHTRRTALVAALMLAAAQANAAAIDVTAVTADIAAQAAPVAAIGAAVLILFVGIKAFKWVRKALS